MKQMTIKRPRTHLAPSARSKQSNALKSNSLDHGQKENFSGNAQNNVYASIEKYTNLAREAVSSGDRILAESFYQLAEHYLRLNNDMKENIVTLPKAEKSYKPKPTATANDFETSIEQELAIAQSKTLT